MLWTTCFILWVYVVDVYPAGTHILWVPSICCGYMLWTTPFRSISCGSLYVVDDVYPQHIHVTSTTYTNLLYVVGVCCGLFRVLPMYYYIIDKIIDIIKSCYSS